MMTDKDNEPAIVERELPIDFYVPDGMIGLYSDAAFVTHTENEFVISFFQADHPVFSNPQQAKKISQVKSRCISRIVLSPPQMEKLIAALSNNYSKFQAKQEIVVKKTS